MKPPYEIRPEGTEASLVTLASLHSQSATDYQQIADEIAAFFPAGADYFSELAAYRTVLQVKLNKLIMDMPGTAHTPTKSSMSIFRSKRSAVVRAIGEKNLSYLADLTMQNENATLKAYREILHNDKVLDFAREVLNEQLETVLEFVRRTERFRTVPQQRNLDVKTRSSDL
ncbi:hypothetical protein [Lewinella sp. W8]|uniref:hypothetical protein n=1 Tax=Lewinella sp. W8 TaxID=2528208 RepID=UPI0010688116|nr:hypothetical protein [Lewinella sp. W8]MTB50920.1 hypothetical protein [Lewinella sp. W8]